MEMISEIAQDVGCWQSEFQITFAVIKRVFTQLNGDVDWFRVKSSERSENLA